MKIPAADTVALQTRLRQVFPANTFDHAWNEFTRRMEKTAVHPRVMLEDLIWEYEAGKWPKPRKVKTGSSPNQVSQ